MIFLMSLYGCNTNSDDKRLDIPSNLRRENYVIMFDGVQNATSYIIEINGGFYEIRTTSYTLNQPGDYSIRVKARAEGYSDSLFTDRLTFTIPLSLVNPRFNYSKSSSFHLTAYLFENNVTIHSIILNEVEVSSDNYQLVDRHLRFHKDYLQTLDIGIHLFTVSLGNLGSFVVTVNIINTILPYIVTHNTTTQAPTKDLVFQYELFGGVFLTLSGNDITSNDYIINENVVTIKTSFIDAYFEAHPELQTLSLKYDLQKDDQFVFGYIFINRFTS